MELIAHRGESADAPENTLESFKLAWERNACAGIEGDFHMLRDGNIVCMHDANTGRTSGVDMELGDCALEDLRGLDIGSWKGPEWKGCKVPTIQQVFATIPKVKKIYVEVKSSPALISRLAEIVRESGLAVSQVVVIAFEPEAIRLSKKMLPSGTKCFLLTCLELKNGSVSPGAEGLVRQLRDCDADGVDCCAHEFLDKSYVDVVHKAGLEFHVWTVNDVDTARRFAAMGVDSITTDCAAFLKENM